jgi:cell division protein ZapA
MSDTATIRIQIGNRSYPLKVRGADEAAYREAERMINEKWKAYETAFSVRDPQDLLAMCALQLATESLHLKNSVEGAQSAVNTEIEDILRMVDAVASGVEA